MGSDSESLPAVAALIEPIPALEAMEAAAALAAAEPSRPSPSTTVAGRPATESPVEPAAGEPEVALRVVADAGCVIVEPLRELCHAAICAPYSRLVSSTEIAANCSAVGNVSVTPECIRLKLFWNAAKHDNFVTATAQGEREALAAGYVFVRVEGYVLDAPSR